MKNMAIRVVNFYKENMPEGERAMLKPGQHFFEKMSKFGVLYFHKFGKDSCETYIQ